LFPCDQFEELVSSPVVDGVVIRFIVPISTTTISISRSVVFFAVFGFSALARLAVRVVTVSGLGVRVIVSVAPAFDISGVRSSAHSAVFRACVGGQVIASIATAFDISTGRTSVCLTVFRLSARACIGGAVEVDESELL
jgi:hypothetical protein